MNNNNFINTYTLFWALSHVRDVDFSYAWQPFSLTHFCDQNETMSYFHVKISWQ